jgi:hypothetical protein
VRVAIDETGDDRRARRVDDLRVARIGRALVGAEVGDATVADKD